MSRIKRRIAHRAPALRAENGVPGLVVGVGPRCALPGTGHRRRCGLLDGDLVGGDDVAAQARVTLENIGAILEAAGATFADVLKVIVYLTDIGDRAASTRSVRSSSATAARAAS